MKKFFCSLSICLVSVLAFAQTGDNLKVRKIVLDNGLTVLLNEDRTEPKVAGAVVIKAGSKNDPEHATGTAHYFEHIMFKGTDSIGTLDYASEKVFLDSISMLYDVLNKMTDKEARKKIEIHINELSIKAAEYAVPNEVDKLLKKYGGTQVNAYTSYDETVYHNVFPPNQMERWLDIYAERFRNPVFRLFQSELETVYEERNMYADVMGSKLIEDFFKMAFKKHPYRNPIIGTVEDLKNPSISKMVKFFQDYYVANNMALILSGDFNTEEVLPMIKEKFGKWRSGEVPAFPAAEYKEEPYAKREFHTGRYLPVKMGGLVYRAVPIKHPDEVAVDICCDLLSYSGTGLLDALRNENKVMEVSASSMQLNDEGVILVIFIPKIISGSLSKTEQAIMSYIDSLKNGRFSDELLNAIKISYKKNFAQSMESPVRRADEIIAAFSYGYTWEEYLAKQERYANITREEIVAAANRYFIDNRLVFYNKPGFSSKAEKIKKPPYKPIIPQNTEKESLFAQRLDSVPATNLTPIFVDLKKDIQYADIQEKVHLVTAPNPVNDIFSLRFTFGTGSHNDSLLRLIDHINELGTETKTLKDFKQAWQKLGAYIGMASNETGTYMYISGFDEYFDETLALLNELLTSVKPDDKQIEKLVEEVKTSNKMEKKDQNSLDDALYEYALKGKNSSYLDRFTAGEIKKIRSEDIVNAFRKIRDYETTITYVGNLSFDRVKETLNRHVKFAANLKDKDEYFAPYLDYSQNTIFLCHNSKANQAAINVYIPGEKINDKERLQTYLFNQYFGVGMSSILFQEIREFRSLSYSAYGSYSSFSRKYPDRKGRFIGFLSCQTDKTNEAIDLLNELLTNMPEKPERLPVIKSAVKESVNTSKPGFRYLPTYAYSLIDQGYTEDTRKLNLEYTQSADFSDIVDFYNHFIKNHPIVYIITGNKSKIDLKSLEKYGKIIEVNKTKLMKQ